MTHRSLVVGCIATLSLVAAVAAQTSSPQQTPSGTPPGTSAPAQAARPPAPPAQQTPAPLVATAEQEKQMLTQYCVACHGERAKASGMDSARKLSIDALDPGNVMTDGEKWELVVAQLR